MLHHPFFFCETLFLFITEEGMAPGPHLTALIDLALAEDIGPGDLTTEALFAPNAQSVGAFVARESMVVSGMHIAAAVFQRIDARCRPL